MSAAILISFLLLGSPVQSVQDSVSAQRIEKLESRVDELEKQVLEYRAREDYFQSILASQRWTFGMVVGLFAALVGLVGFGAFKHYINRVEQTEESMKKQVEDLTSELETKLSGLSERQDYTLERIRVLERRQETSGSDIVESIAMGEYPITFIDKSEWLLDKLPVDDKKYMERHIFPTVDIMRMGLEKIEDEYKEVPIILKEKGLPLLKEIESLLEGWEKEREIVRGMIQTIEEG